MSTRTMGRGVYMRMKTMAFQHRMHGENIESLSAFGAPLKKAKLNIININRLVIRFGVALHIVAVSIIIYALLYLR